MLIAGAVSVIRFPERHKSKRFWLVRLLARKKFKVAAVALANKHALMTWGMMTNGERYHEPQVAWNVALIVYDVGNGGQELMHKVG